MSSFKKSISYFLLFMICCMSFLGSIVNVYADSVTSLPAHSDITSSFDANYIYLNTPSGDYTINRNTKLTGILQSRNKTYYYPYYSETTRYYRGVLSGSSDTMDNDFYLPTSFEKDNAGHLLDTCYWYSPSQNIVYILNSAYNPTLKASTCHVLSYYSSSPSFYVDSDNMSGKYTCYFIHQLNLSTGVTSYGVGKSVSSSSRFSTSSLSYIYYSSTTDLSQSYNFGSKSFPSDLVCIYSSYTIDGFWEYDASSDIVTPDYYFNYQYLFEGVNNNIIFIDSSKPLVRFDADGTLRFSDICNKRIYLSTDGKAWTNIVNQNLMYSGSYTLASSYFLDGDNVFFRLVYSNDETYGEEPIVKPEFNPYFTEHDFYSGFPGWIELYCEGYSDWPDAYKDAYPYNSVDSFSGLKAFLYGGFSAVSDFLSGFGFDQSVVDSIFNVETLNLSDAVLVNIFSNITKPYNYQYDSDGNLVSRTRTLYGYLQLLSSNGYDTVFLLEEFRTDLSKQLSSLFDINSFNADQLINISGILKKIKIPDYTGKLDTIVAAINGIHFTVPESVPFDDSDILSAINNIGFDDSRLLAAINGIDLNVDFNPDFDLDFGDSLSVDLDPIVKLLEFDITDYDDDKTDDDTSIIDFVTDGVQDILSGSIIANSLNFDSGVLAGIGLINGYVVQIYDGLGSYKPVVLLGLTFGVVNTVVRREEAHE